VYAMMEADFKSSTFEPSFIEI